VSGIRPYELVTWALEAAPMLLALFVLLRTRRRYPLSDLVYLCVLLYVAVLALVMGPDRTPYAGLGHFLQGFALALVVREVLIRSQVVRGSRLLSVFVASIVLALSAAFEVVKWATALAFGEDGALPAQVDMLLALAGAASALVVFARVHDWRLKRLDRVRRDLVIEPRSAH
jgi:putative membrane protein